MIYVLAFFIGGVAGLRAFTPLAVISWAAWLGWIDLSATPLGFLGHIAAVIILSLVAIGEYVGDQLPATPSRKVPMQFGARIVMGAVAGALLMPPSWIIGALLGAAGAVVGTLAGAEARAWLAASLDRDLPAGLLEDGLALIAAFLIVYLA
jgi:uncharacterized membrane protein